ncbi:adhesion G-protein coupled receptor D1-like isoform X2 [Ostrea edulis]|uniref:adhesion G-protein coupled receptor D1-like isoform X2 n=1 Tax=Ostrea edulis TaxID=37623 RepID=UPI0024AF76BA|nr:adhesion G-protein coupled receptor D1-like isoform X2 [Ostrea edulis]
MMLNPPIQLKFLLNANTIPNSSHCVFWDFNRNAGNGGWSTKGCRRIMVNHLVINCTCNHLTNFAVLVRPKSKRNEDALSWMSRIGCVISIISSTLTVLCYTVFWKSITSEVSKPIDKITVSLCLSIAMAYSLFLGGVDKIEYQVGCTIITALLQAVFLHIFFLMLVLALLYFANVTLVKLSFSKSGKFQNIMHSKKKYVLGIVIGMPICITAVTFGISAIQHSNYHTKMSCWLSSESGSLYGFLIPVGIIVLLNIVVLVSLIVTACSSRLLSQRTAKKRALSGIKFICTLVPLLGVNWLFGFLSVSDDSTVFQYVFAISNSLQVMFDLKSIYTCSLLSIERLKCIVVICLFQGLFIFITKCLMNKKMQKVFMKNVWNVLVVRLRDNWYMSQSNESSGTHSTDIKNSNEDLGIHLGEHFGRHEYFALINEKHCKGISFTPTNNPVHFERNLCESILY